MGMHGKDWLAMPSRDLRRRPRQQQPRQSILIVCLGEQTEFRYFQALKQDFRLPAVRVAIESTSRDPHSVIALARRLHKQGAFDEVWCVFDHEFPPNNTLFQPAVEAARQNSFKLAVSNPAFEVWLLLHFRYTARSFTDNNELVHQLRNAYPSSFR